MADPDRIIFVPANIYQATGTTEASPPSYPVTGDSRTWYVVPDVCFDSPPEKLYQPGNKRVQDFQYRECWRGWPYITYTLQFVDTAEYVLLMNQYIAANDLDGWVWAAIYSAETRTYKIHQALIEEPKVGSFDNGPLYGNVTLTFSHIWPTEFSI